MVKLFLLALLALSRRICRALAQRLEANTKWYSVTNQAVTSWNKLYEKIVYFIEPVALGSTPPDRITKQPRFDMITPLTYIRGYLLDW